MVLVLTFGLVPADHIDAPDVAVTTADITDFYTFEAAIQDNTVFAAKCTRTSSSREYSTI